MTITNTNHVLASFGRRRGRKLRSGKQSAMDDVLPRFSLTGDFTQSDGWKYFASNHSTFWLEIGFGGGEHLAHMASVHPEIGFIGSEPYVNGIANLLASLDSQNAQNVKLYTDDARIMLDQIRAADEQSRIAFSRVYILFPDPWHKLRHHKRRLVTKEFLNQLKPLLATGASVRLATDHTDYARQMLEVFLSDADFRWTAKSSKDWNTRFEDSIQTRYEAKGLGDMKPQFFEFMYNVNNV